MELIMTIKAVNRGNLTNEFIMLMDDLLGSTLEIEHIERDDRSTPNVDYINRKIYGSLSPLKRRELRKELVAIGDECNIHLSTRDIDIDPERKFALSEQK